MGVRGLTLYHVKSHLQKYRQGRPEMKESTKLKNGKSASGCNVAKSSSNSPSCSSFQENHSKNTNSKAKVEGGSIYLQMQSEKVIQRFMAAQNNYLNLAQQNAQNMLANHYYQGANIGNISYNGQDLLNAGKMAPMPNFYQNQLNNTYNAYNPTGQIKAYSSSQAQYHGFQPPVASQPSSFPSVSYPASSYHEGFGGFPIQDGTMLQTSYNCPAAAYRIYDASFASTSILA